MGGGIFGSMFDFNNDGEMDFIERAAECSFIQSLIDEEEAESKASELEASGLDVDDLSMMDYDERIEVLEDAGLDPDDYDFD